MIYGFVVSEKGQPALPEEKECGILRGRFILHARTEEENKMDKSGKLIPELTINEAYQLKKEGVISGGMIPKVETCIEAVRNGAEAAVILDGRLPHAVLLELFTSQGHGTIIRKE